MRKYCLTCRYSFDLDLTEDCRCPKCSSEAITLAKKCPICGEETSEAYICCEWCENELRDGIIALARSHKATGYSERKALAAIAKMAELMSGGLR